MTGNSTGHKKMFVIGDGLESRNKLRVQAKYHEGLKKRVPPRGTWRDKGRLFAVKTIKVDKKGTKGERTGWIAHIKLEAIG